MRVFIRDLEFYAYHGVPDAERSIGHRYVANVEFEVDDRSGESDLVQDSVDYGEVALRLQEIAQESSHKTLERLVTVCGRGLLSEYPSMRSLILYIGKRMPPAPVVADEVGVERVFFRDEA
jgi:dihydroneopterin aldolase